MVDTQKHIFENAIDNAGATCEINENEIKGDTADCYHGSKSYKYGDTSNIPDGDDVMSMDIGGVDGGSAGDLKGQFFQSNCTNIEKFVMGTNNTQLPLRW